MSDKIDLLEEEIKRRMLSYELRPPAEVWSGIVKERSFGHKVCNRILQSHYYLSLLLLALLSMSYFVVPEKSVVAMYAPSNSDEKLQTIENIRPKSDTAYKNSHLPIGKQLSPSLVQNTTELPQQDVTASSSSSTMISAAVFNDPTLSRIFSNSNSIPIVEEFELIHYERMQELKGKKLKSLNQTRGKYPRPLMGNKLNFLEIEQHRWSLLLMAGPELISKSFQLEYYLSQQYVEKRKNNLRSRQAYTFSTRLNYIVRKNTFLEMGLDFSRIDETSVIGNKTLNSSFSFLSIPLLLGHERSTARIGWEIKGGLSYQLYNSFTGEIPGINERAWDLNNPSENPYKLSGVVNIHFATGLSYLYSERLKVLVQPYYKRSLNSVSKSTAAFNENFNYLGVGLGLKFDL